MKSRLSLAALAVIGALLSASSSLATDQPTTFTYQGQLKSGGSFYTGTCSFNVLMFDTPDSVTGLLGTQNLTGISVTGGLFTLPLNGAAEFGSNPFSGDARWLTLQVKCGADGGFTGLTPRVAITSTPYALGLKLPVSETVTASSAALGVNNVGTGIGIYGSSVNNWGIGATSTSNTGLQAHSNTFYGVYADSGTGIGVAGVSGGSSAGVFGTSASGDGVHGTGHNGVFGSTSLAAGFGVYGENTSNVGVAIKGVGLDGVGVEGSGTTAGVNGIGSPGVKGTGSFAGALGVYGLATGGGSGVYGQNADLVNGHGGTFDGNVSIQGGGALNVGANGTKIKRILAGTATVGSNGTASTTYTVNFAFAFSGTPHAVAIAHNDPNLNVADTFVVSIRQIGTNAVVFNIIRIDSNAGWGQSLQLDWMAWE